MEKYGFKYIYGPVSSWRLGISLGIDLLSAREKICNFDCIYCQLGKSLKLITQPKVYVEAREIISELKKLPKVKIDYITFSGRGEPSLAANLGQVIQEVKKLNIAPIAVLTNSGLIYQPEIRKNLSGADFVIVKLDACSQQALEKINRPDKTISFDKIIQGIKQFKRGFKGKFALQIMFTEANQVDARRLAELARQISPDEIQLNTSLRPCNQRPLSKQEIERIKESFSGSNFISVYNVRPKKAASFSKEETLKRRGKIV